MGGVCWVCDDGAKRKVLEDDVPRTGDAPGWLGPENRKGERSLLKGNG